MNFNSKMGYSEQDYQLLKEATSGITGKVDKIADDVAAKSPEIGFGSGSFTIEKNVPFYGFVAGYARGGIFEHMLNSPNLSCEIMPIESGTSYGEYPRLNPIVWDGTKGSFTIDNNAVKFTLADDTQPGTLNIGSTTNIYTIKINLNN